MNGRTVDGLAVGGLAVDGGLNLEGEVQPLQRPVQGL